MWIAHRGGHPENAITSLVSFLKVDSVARGIEFDVQLTADDVPVIFHDHETERLTGESGTIVERTWEEVCSLRSHGERISRLEELGHAIAALEPRPRLLNVEFKPTGRSNQLIEAATPFFEDSSFFP